MPVLGRAQNGTSVRLEYGTCPPACREPI